MITVPRYLEGFFLSSSNIIREKSTELVGIMREIVSRHTKRAADFRINELIKKVPIFSNYPVIYIYWGVKTCWWLVSSSDQLSPNPAVWLPTRIITLETSNK